MYSTITVERLRDDIPNQINMHFNSSQSTLIDNTTNAIAMHDRIKLIISQMIIEELPFTLPVRLFIVCI